jgi:hypothetical protein
MDKLYSQEAYQRKLKMQPKRGWGKKSALAYLRAALSSTLRISRLERRSI